MASTSSETPRQSGPRNPTIVADAAGASTARSTVSSSMGASSRPALRVTTPAVSHRSKIRTPASTRAAVTVGPIPACFGEARLNETPTLSHEKGATRACTSVRVVESGPRSPNAESVNSRDSYSARAPGEKNDLPLIERRRFVVLSRTPHCVNPAARTYCDRTAVESTLSVAAVVEALCPDPAPWPAVVRLSPALIVAAVSCTHGQGASGSRHDTRR